MTSDDSGLQFQMPGPDPRIGEESCRESGSGKPLEVRYFPLKWPSIPLTWSICENQHVTGPMELSNQCLLLFWIHCHAKPHRQRMAQGIEFDASLKRINFLLTKEKHSGHEEVTLEVRTLPKPGFSSSMETVLRWVWQNSIFQYDTIIIIGQWYRSIWHSPWHNSSLQCWWWWWTRRRRGSKRAWGW